MRALVSGSIEIGDAPPPPPAPPEPPAPPPPPAPPEPAAPPPPAPPPPSLLFEEELEQPSPINDASSNTLERPRMAPFYYVYAATAPRRGTASSTRASPRCRSSCTSATPIPPGSRRRGHTTSVARPPASAAWRSSPPRPHPR